MREWKIPGPLAPDDPFYAMLDMSDRHIWYSVDAIDWLARLSGAPREACKTGLVPTSQGLVVITARGIRDIPFDSMRNLRTSGVGFQGFVEMEGRAADGTWRELKWSTKRAAARAVVELLTELMRASAPDH